LTKIYKGLIIFAIVLRDGTAGLQAWASESSIGPTCYNIAYNMYPTRLQWYCRSRQTCNTHFL